MGDLVKRFTSFDKMMGTSIIKVLYFIGVAGIVLFTVLGMLGSLASMGSSFLGGLGGFILTPIMGLVGLLFWRFMCEIYILFFKISDDVAAMRTRGEVTDTFE